MAERSEIERTFISYIEAGSRNAIDTMEKFLRDWEFRLNSFLARILVESKKTQTIVDREPAFSDLHHPNGMGSIA